MAELGGEPQATVIGLETGLPAANAAFANGMLCHGLDFDDTHSDSVSHVSAVVTPASLAAGEGGRRQRTGRAHGDRRRQRGRHPGGHGRLGPVPHARLPPDGHLRHLRRHGLGRQARRARRRDDDAGARHRRLDGVGIFAYLEDGTPTKPIHPAWAAHGAHLATRLAYHGAAGPQSVFEGKFGLYHSFLGAEPGEVDIDGQIADLGSRWETPRIAYKPYPGLPLHARLARRSRPGARRGGRSPRTRSTR